MSKYQKLWENISSREAPALSLTFEEAGEIAGIPIDHSFLRFKKELLAYGFQVDNISMKEQKIFFSRVAEL